jgi:hypothetical protein
VLLSQAEIERDPTLWMLREDEGDDEHLSFGQLAEETDGSGLIVESSRVIVPKRGKLFESDGSMKICVIRPCVSRGKRLGAAKLPPIYEAAMLQRNAGVFSGWPMYMDHLIAEALEEMAEALREAADGTDLLGWLEERSRSIKELGGRIIESWWDPTVTFADDDDFGYRPGGVVARAIPQPEPKQMLEADPGILNVSINAWPTGARAGAASWSQTLRGMIVEGIRRKPMGSVDWVFRGGAGGRPLLEEDEEFRARAVSLLEGVYSAARSKDRPKKRTQKVADKKLSEMTADELRAHLKEEGAEGLIPALAESDNGNGGGSSAATGDDKPVTRNDVRAIVREAVAETTEALTEQLEESTGSIDERVTEEVERREESRVLERKAEQLLNEAVRNGFPKASADDIRLRYTVAPSGPTPGLVIQEADLTVTEGEGDKAKEVKVTAPQVVERRIRADIEHVINLLRESGANPVVKGFGPAKKDPGSETVRRGGQPSAFRAFLAERNLLPSDPDKHEDAIKEMVQEGAGYAA